MSDNELDNLFKEAAEGFTPPQDASAWKQMADMLDKNPVKPAGFWNWKSISVITTTGLIAVTAVWFASVDQKEIVKTTEANGSTHATQGVAQEQKEQAHPAGKENFSPPQSVEDKANDLHVVSKTELKNNQHSGERPAPAISVQAPKRNFNPRSSNSNQFQRPENVEPVELPAEAVVTPTDKSELTAIRADAEYNASTSGTGAGQPELSADSANAVTTGEVMTDSAVNQTDRVDHKKDNTKSRGVISIKAIVSPDFSSVNYFSAGKMGINYGVLAGYSFNNRWSVYTGVISSKKLYDTKEVEGSYNWDGHDYPVKELDGDCRILDIPINVYYTFFPEQSFSLRAGLGFSSYIMRSETYVYCVDNYGTDAYYAQRIVGENNEWFKVMNLSVAVSKKFTNRLSAEFEPFVKAPLAGVGEGKVSLVSMGAFINLKFDLIQIK